MKKDRVTKAAVIIAAISALGIAAFWSKPVVRHYILEGPADGLRILLLSDLHGYVYGKDQSELIGLVRKEQPDIVLLAGDIIDYQVGFEGTELFLDGIKGIAPIFYVTGNHEYFGGSTDGIAKMLEEKYGVIVLSDELRQVEINGHELIIAGVEDPLKERVLSSYDQYYSMEEAFGGLQKDDGIYKILLAHRPERYRTYIKYPFDLIVSGHTHGGQARIPLILNGLYAPNQGYFPRYAGGFYRHDGVNHIVSRGIGLWPEVPRIFNPPEICLIEIKSEK